MAQVAFWGPNINQSGSTSIAACVASLLALQQDYSSLLVSTNFMDSTLETSFINIEKLSARSSIDFTDIGIDALERLIKSGKLAPENIVDYTTPILKGRLDIMFGTQKKEKEVYTKVIQMLPNILKSASSVYDVIFVDIVNGRADEDMMKILESSDLIVININQSINVMNDFFKNVINSDILKNKKFVLVFGRYDRYSKYNLKNVAKFYKYKEPIFAFPYNTQFFDMQNEHKVLEFFIKYLKVKESDRNGFFVNEMQNLTNYIMDNIVISTDR